MEDKELNILLALGIAEILCCCQPMGIATVIMVVIANSNMKNGLIEERDKKVKWSKILLIIGLVGGIIIAALYIILTALGYIGN